MKFSALVVAGFVSLLPMAFATQNKVQDTEPTVFGMLGGNTGCVIFAEGRKTSGRFYGIAATMKTVGKLTLIETQNDTFDQKEVLETQENLNGLMQTAQKDRIKFVKIPEKHSPELLEKARASCKP